MTDDQIKELNRIHSNVTRAAGNVYHAHTEAEQGAKDAYLAELCQEASAELHACWSDLKDLAEELQ